MDQTPVFLQKLKLLLQQNRPYYRIDLHIHSIFSSDGEDTIEAIISRAREYDFDIISVTDHDEIKAYEYLESMGDRSEICIIPGVEFSAYSKAYGSMFHVLQYGFSIHDPLISRIVAHNHAAQENRFKKQCELLTANPLFYTLSTATADDLFQALRSRTTDKCLPDYIDFGQYVYELAQKQGMSIKDLLRIYKKAISEDLCERRRVLNLDNYEWIAARIKERPYVPARMVKKMIANPLTEDSLFDADISGNISISDYGQVRLNEISEEYVTVLAHPEYRKATRLSGYERSIFDFLENNYSNSHISSNEFADLKNLFNVPETVGSDFHYSAQHYYDNKDFYLVPKIRLQTIYDALCRKARMNKQEGEIGYVLK